MPTKREREYYRMGYTDGYSHGMRGMRMDPSRDYERRETVGFELPRAEYAKPPKKRSRKLSGWQKYIKNKRNHIKYRDGKLNLKKMGVAYRRKKRR
tara:strand:+ start:343 stop:630 length:288 start_codon:yes stop_codon:yes gene_type:complete